MVFTTGENPTDESKDDEEEEEDPMDTFYPQALAGFIMVTTEEGDMIYLTENVSKHIGITQVTEKKRSQQQNFSLHTETFDPHPPET